jgi:two-component system cell cycle response regulator
MTINILVAGSHLEYSDLARQAFEDLDCQIIPATSMTLAVFLAQKNLPDVILSDFEMFDGDGWNFIAEIKADDELRNIPFVFIAPDSNADAAAHAAELGADAILKYPMEASQLKRELVPYINIRLAEKGQRLPQTPE